MSNNLDLDQVLENQSAKELTINDALGQLDAALTEMFTVSLASGNATVAAGDYERNVAFKCTGATVARIVTLPAQKKTSIVINTGSHSITASVGTTNVVLQANSVALLYSDGTANGLFNITGGVPAFNGAFTGLSDVPASYTSQALKMLRVKSDETAVVFEDTPYDIPIAVSGVTTASEKLAIFTAVRAFVIKATAPLSKAVAGIAATGSTTITLKKNGSSFGTIVWSASGTVGAFTVSSDTSFAAGDILIVAAPVTPDATLADIGITLAGIRQ